MEIILAPYLISATLTPTKVIVGIAAIAWSCSSSGS